MKKVLLALTLLAVVIPVYCFAESDIYGQYQDFRWQEFDDSGAKLLEESGPLFGFGYSGRYYPSSLILLRPKAEVFGGTVDYDGQTQSGIPVNTETDYFGIKAEGDLGLKFGSKVLVEPFAGLGYRWWQRDIQSTSVATGYEEDWSTFYGRLGLRGTVYVKSKAEVFLEALAKLPIENRETAHLGIAGLGDVELKPGKRTSYYAEAGFRYKKFRAVVFYETLKFSKSDSVFVTDGVFVYEIWQPESETEIIGLNLGVTF